MKSKIRISILLFASLVGSAMVVYFTENKLLSKDQKLSRSENSFEKSDTVKHKRSTRVLDQPGAEENGKILNAVQDVKLKGSYEQLKNLLRSMSRTERLEFLSGKLCTVESGFGFQLDIPEKMAVIDEFGEGRADYFKKKVLANMVSEIDEVADIDFIRSMNLDLWKLALASASIQNVSKAFELSNADVGIERQELGVSEVLRHWLGSDAVAASERVSRMPQSQLRDIATREIACWLRSKNCVEDADRWAESISDPAIKSEAFR